MVKLKVKTLKTRICICIFDNNHFFFCKKYEKQDIRCALEDYINEQATDNRQKD